MSSDESPWDESRARAAKAVEEFYRDPPKPDKSLARILAEDFLRKAQIVPLEIRGLGPPGDGAVQIEWHIHGVDLEIGFDSQGVSGILFSRERP